MNFHLQSMDVIVLVSESNSNIIMEWGKCYNYKRYVAAAAIFLFNIKSLSLLSSTDIQIAFYFMLLAAATTTTTTCVYANAWTRHHAVHCRAQQIKWHLFETWTCILHIKCSPKSRLHQQKLRKLNKLARKEHFEHNENFPMENHVAVCAMHLGVR